VTTIQLPSDVEAMKAEEVLRFCVDSFPGKVALACSFQKEESVLLDMLFAIDSKARVFAIDTHHLFPETYELWRATEERYGVTIEKFEGAAVEEGLWDAKPDLYLAKAKVEPLNRALLDLDCWITGVRRDQSATRANAEKLGWDAAHELWKANPLGYSSIGDTHSTQPGEGREGRWAGSDRTECGLHT